MSLVYIGLLPSHWSIWSSADSVLVSFDLPTVTGDCDLWSLDLVDVPVGHDSSWNEFVSAPSVLDSLTGPWANPGWAAFLGQNICVLLTTHVIKG